MYIIHTYNNLSNCGIGLNQHNFVFLLKMGAFGRSLGIFQWVLSHGVSGTYVRVTGGSQILFGGMNAVIWAGNDI